MRLCYWKHPGFATQEYACLFCRSTNHQLFYLTIYIILLLHYSSQEQAKSFSISIKTWNVHKIILPSICYKCTELLRTIQAWWIDRDNCDSIPITRKLPIQLVFFFGSQQVYQLVFLRWFFQRLSLRFSFGFFHGWWWAPPP